MKIIITIEPDNPNEQVVIKAPGDTAQESITTQSEPALTTNNENEYPGY